MKYIRNVLIKTLIAGALAICGLALPFSTVYAAGTNSAKNAVCSGISSAGAGTCAQNSQSANSGTSTLTRVIRTGINIFTIIVGIAAVFVIMIAGIRYAVSGGDSAVITSAKNSIIYALVGVTIAAVAQVIVRYVITTIH